MLPPSSGLVRAGGAPRRPGRGLHRRARGARPRRPPAAAAGDPARPEPALPPLRAQPPAGRARGHPPAADRGAAGPGPRGGRGPQHRSHRDPVARRRAEQPRPADARARRAGADVHRPDRRADAAARARPGPAALGRDPARHRQAAGAGHPAQQGGQARRGGVGPAAGSPGARRGDRRCPAALARRVGPGDRGAPRALGRHRLPERTGRPRDPPRLPDRLRRRRVRRDDLGACLQAAGVARRGVPGADPLLRHAVRPRCCAGDGLGVGASPAPGTGTAGLARRPPTRCHPCRPRRDSGAGGRCRRGCHRRRRGRRSPRDTGTSGRHRPHPRRSPARHRQRASTVRRGPDGAAYDGDRPAGIQPGQPGAARRRSPAVRQAPGPVPRRASDDSPVSTPTPTVRPAPPARAAPGPSGSGTLGGTVDDVTGGSGPWRHRRPVDDVTGV